MTSAPSARPDAPAGPAPAVAGRSSKLGATAGGVRAFAGFLRPYRWRLGVATMLSLLQAAMVLAQPWPLKLAIDHAIGGKPLDGWLAPLAGFAPQRLATAAALLTVVIVSVAGLIGFVRTLVVAGVSERLGADLREAAMRSALAQSTAFHAAHGSGDVLNRCSSDADAVKRAMMSLTLGVVPPIATVTGVLVVLFSIDKTLSLVGLGVLPMLLVINLQRGRRARAIELVARDQGGRLTTEAIGLLRGVHTIQAFGRADLADRRFADKSRELERTGVRAARALGSFGPLTELALSVGAALTLWFGVRRVLAGDLPVGTLLVLLSYLGSVLSPVQQLVDLLPSLLQASASFERITELFAVAPGAGARRPGLRPAPLERCLTLHEIRFGYRDGAEVLQGIDLVVPAGQRVCIVGPSGAGKTTLIDVLLRFREPTSGVIRYDGVDAASFDLDAWRAQFALVPQDAWLMEGTIAENIALGRKDVGPADVALAAQRAGVAAFAKVLPDRLDTWVGEHGERLSVGQRLKVVIARALVRAPSVLVLDEPTSALDAHSEQDFLTSLDRAAFGVTTMVVSHRLAVAEWADRVIVLAGGLVVEDGPPAILRSAGGPYAALVAAAGSRGREAA